MIIISLSPFSRVMYNTNQAKNILSFNQDNILRISIRDIKWSLDDNYKILLDDYPTKSL
ncbi:MAG: hypothetical protein ACI8WT_004214 [Clostridium sp.]|jgi:hypothetical protein